MTTKKLITESIVKKENKDIDAFILIDCDDFKSINDTHGHLVGNQVLESISKIMKLTFRKSDICGRIGGDEFCIYVKDIPSIEFVHEKIQELRVQLKEVSTVESASVSIGIVLFNFNDVSNHI